MFRDSLSNFVNLLIVIPGDSHVFHFKLNYTSFIDPH